MLLAKINNNSNKKETREAYCSQFDDHKNHFLWLLFSAKNRTVYHMNEFANLL